MVPPRLDAREFDALLEAKAGGASQRRGVERQQEEEYGAPVEMDDLGGMDPLDQRDPTQHDGQYEEPERDPSPSPSPRKSQAAAPLSPPPQSRALFTSSPAPSSPPPPTRPRPPQHATSDSADPSSDAAPLPPLPVVAEPTRLLKEQTSLLLAQLGAAVPAAPVKGSNASRVLRKRVSAPLPHSRARSLIFLSSPRATSRKPLSAPRTPSATSPSLHARPQLSCPTWPTVTNRVASPATAPRNIRKEAGTATRTTRIACRSSSTTRSSGSSERRFRGCWRAVGRVRALSKRRKILRLVRGRRGRAGGRLGSFK